MLKNVKKFSSVAQSYLTLCNPMDCSTPGFPVHHQLPELPQTHVHWVCDAIQSSHPLSSPPPPALNVFQHEGLFQWVSFLHQVTKVLVFQVPASILPVNIQGWFPLGLIGLISLQSKVLSSHLILCRPLFLLPPIPPGIRVFSNESTLRMRWPKYWSFSISPSNEYSILISFRMDWLDFLAIQGTLKSLLQHYSSKASIL